MARGQGDLCILESRGSQTDQRMVRARKTAQTSESVHDAFQAADIKLALPLGALRNELWAS